MNLLIVGLRSVVFLFLFLTSSIAQENTSYLNPPIIIENPNATSHYNADNRLGTGIPSLAISRGGRIWSVWYVGITPGVIVERCPYNYIVVASSGDNGETWEEVIAIDPDEAGPVRGFDPEIWFDPDGKLWVFWSQQIRPIESTKSGVWVITTTEGDSPRPNWSKPQRIVDGVMMCKPTVLSNGEWALPVSYWHMKEESAKMIVSNDRGKSWKEKGYVAVPKDYKNFDEHMIVEKNDGSLLMWMRTKFGIGESISKDGGKNWSDVQPSGVIHPNSRFFIRRLKSGNLLLVKHGPLLVKTGRSHLMAFISQDDGNTWSRGLLLDERNGVTYPDGDQTEDGTIYITYDFGRNDEQHILMTSFSEEDVLSPDYDSSVYKVYKNRKMISDAGR